MRQVEKTRQGKIKEKRRGEERTKQKKKDEEKKIIVVLGIEDREEKVTEKILLGLTNIASLANLNDSFILTTWRATGKSPAQPKYIILHNIGP